MPADPFPDFPKFCNVRRVFESESASKLFRSSKQLQSFKLWMISKGMISIDVV